jgi:membrane-associated protease RseP (regulator of RpoE activity)
MRLEDVDETHTGFLQSVLSGFDWEVEAAEGVVGQPITLPAGVWYRVRIVAGAREPRSCGEVHLHAGGDTTLVCARGEATLAGQNVDEDGRALGTNLELTVGGVKTATTSDARGRFRVTTEVEGAVIAELAVVTNDGAPPRIVRRNIVAAAGTARDLGRVVVRAPLGPDAAPLGAALTEDRYGFAVEQVTRDSAIELAGVDPGDRIVEIDGDDALELPLADALARLGKPGAPPLVRIRTANGELYDLELTP